MLKQIKLVLLLLVSFQSQSQNLEADVQSLKTTQQIDSVWLDMFMLDQKYRGEQTNDSIDNLNFKKMLLMIEHHGYPQGNITPNVIFFHQRSNFVCEYYFPILSEAFRAGKSDTSWFLHDIRRLHRGRFDRDYLQPDQGNYMKVIERLAGHLNTNLDYSIEPFDSLFQGYLNTISDITSSEKLGHWITDFYGEYNLILYKKGDQLYIERRWAKSVVLPQEVLYNKETKAFTYKNKCCGIEYRIVNGNMCKFEEGELKSTYTPKE